MKIQRGFLLIVLLGIMLPLLSKGERPPVITPAIRTVYGQILDLKLGEAHDQLQRLVGRNSGNPMVYTLENYIDFLTLFIGESQSDYNRLLPRRDQRIQAIRKTDEESPYYRFSEAHIRLQWALIMIKMGHRIRAFKEIASAYLLLDKNRGEFPGFLPDKMTYGFIQAVIGALPDDVQWWVSWMGIKGDINRGLSDIKAVLEVEGAEQMFLPEAVGMVAFIYVNLKGAPERVSPYLESVSNASAGRYLFEFLRAYVSLKQHNAAGALSILNAMDDRAEGRLAFPYLSFMKGMAHMQTLDPEAKRYFHHFIQTFNGRHYIKEAYQKLAWCDVLFHTGCGYDKWMIRCRDEGVAMTDSDKAAMEEALAGKRPDKCLLEARVLLDGGAYDRSLAVLTRCGEGAELPSYSSMMVDYMKARNYEQKGDWSSALHYYGRVLQYDAFDRDYRLCNACYHMGLIYYRLGNKKLARYYYREVLKRTPDRYALTLHSKATSGLNLIK